MQLKDFNETFDHQLRDPAVAALYLEESAKDGSPALLLALRDIIRANGGMSVIAEKASLNRESLYRALSENGNPELRTLQSVLDAIGLQMSFTTKAA